MISKRRRGLKELPSPLLHSPIPDKKQSFTREAPEVEDRWFHFKSSNHDVEAEIIRRLLVGQEILLLGPTLMKKECSVTRANERFSVAVSLSFLRFRDG